MQTERLWRRDMGFTAIIDTREKEPWRLIASTIDNTVVRKLDTGDYSIEGLEENILCIERKRSVAEFAANVSAQRFKNELERMLEFKYRYLVFEFTVSQVRDYPVGSGIPKSRWKKLKVRGDYIMKCISQIQVKYGVNVIFAGDASNAEYIGVNLMKRVYERERGSITDTET